MALRFASHRLSRALTRYCKPLLIHSMALASTLTALGVFPLGSMGRALALNDYCHVSQASASAKEALRRSTFEGGDPAAAEQYQALVQQHASAMQDCRSRKWPRQQAIWLRLYPCDLQPGILEAVMDRIVNLGYNQVYVEVFYGGQVLLPQADNPLSGLRWFRPMATSAEIYLLNRSKRARTGA
jgi:hypothetical protein